MKMFEEQDQNFETFKSELVTLQNQISIQKDVMHEAPMASSTL